MIMHHELKQNNINEMGLNLSLCYIHINILSLLDKLLSKNILFLSEDILNKLLDCLEASIIISNNFNSNIQLRLFITDYNKNNPNHLSSMMLSISNDDIINLFSQFQIAVKNFYIIIEYLYNIGNNMNSNKQNYYKRIMDVSIKIINYYANENKEFNAIINKTDNETEVKKKENGLNNFFVPLRDYIFPAIQKIEFYKNERYRDIVCKLLFDLIMCYDPRIREIVKDALNIVFSNILKNENQSKEQDK
jgi:hypothetical protein